MCVDNLYTHLFQTKMISYALLFTHTHKNETIILLFVLHKCKHDEMAKVWCGGVSDIQECKQAHSFGSWCQSSVQPETIAKFNSSVIPSHMYMYASGFAGKDMAGNI